MQFAIRAPSSTAAAASAAASPAAVVLLEKNDSDNCDEHVSFLIDWLSSADFRPSFPVAPPLYAPVPPSRIRIERQQIA